MQSRLAIVMMSVAGTAALFGVGFLLGLGVMSTPKPEHHKQIALTTTPTKVAHAETTGAGAQSERALTPLTPVAPGGAAAPTAPAQSEPTPAKATLQGAAPQPTQQQTAAAPAEPAPQPEPKVQPKQETPASAPVQTTTKAEPASPPNATPVSLASGRACDVQACSRAYRSFRESDCTYQPFSGPRQVCVGPPGAKEAARGHDSRQALRGDDDEPAAHVRVHRPGRDVELSNVVHEVERMTDSRASGDDDRPVARRYHRDYTADGEDDRVVPADVDRGGFDDEDDQ